MAERPVLETQRTYFKPICRGDFDELVRILGDPEIMYAWEHGFSADEVRGWIDENIRRYAADGYSYWAVRCRANDRLIGVCGLLKETAAQQTYVGLGYIFHKAYWGQGFALECASACKSYAFVHLHVPLLTAQIRPNNAASIKVAQRLGMSVRLSFERVYRGKSMPHLLFACTK